MIDNPVLRKELLTRYRNRQARGGLFLAWLIMGIVVVGVYYLVISWLIRATNDPDASGSALQMILIVEFSMICLIAPAAAANSITQEKEQQTWEMLVFTRLTPIEIVLGKLVARLVPVLAILLAFSPLALYCWFTSLGTSTTAHMDSSGLVLGCTLLLMSALTFTTIGLAASWWTSRTLYAIMVSYTVVIGGLTIGTALVASALTDLGGTYQSIDHMPLWWINPVYMMGRVLTSDRSPEDTAHLLCGLLFYAMISAGLLATMIVRFRSATD